MELTSDVFLPITVIPGSFYSFIHLFLQSIHPLFHPPIHPSSAHASSPGSLRQEVLQLQLSAKASLKGNSLTPYLSLVSHPRLVQKLLNLSTVHAVNSAATHMLNSYCWFCPATLNSFISSPSNTFTAQAAYWID